MIDRYIRYFTQAFNFRIVTLMRATMKKQDWINIFGNDALWSSVKKIDRKMLKNVRLLNHVIFNEVFNKFYLNFESSSDISLEEIRNQIAEVNKLIYNRNLAIACRRIKGLLEDSIAFICLNTGQSDIDIDSNTRPADYRKFLIKNSEMIFTIVSEEVSKEYDFLTKIYDYIAKIDHNTSITSYTKNLEQNKKINNIQYSYFSIVCFVIYLLFDFKITKSRHEINEDVIFVMKAFSVLNTLILLSFILNYNHDEFLRINLISGLNNKTDEKYLNELKTWSSKIIESNSRKLSFEDNERISELIRTFDSELKERGYLSE